MGARRGEGDRCILMADSHCRTPETKYKIVKSIKNLKRKKAAHRSGHMRDWLLEMNKMHHDWLEQRRTLRSSPCSPACLLSVDNLSQNKSNQRNENVWRQRETVQGDQIIIMQSLSKVKNL